MSVRFMRFLRRNRGDAAFIFWMSALMIMSGNEAGGAPAAPSAPVKIQSVSSSAQRSGVTAGVVHQLYQTVLPSLVRGPQLEKLKATFSEGAKLYRASQSSGPTDAQIDGVCNQTDRWANATFDWLHKQVSEYAAERFAFRPPGLPLSYNLPGQHAPGYAERWGSCRNALAELLTNLDQLMRDPSIYPEPSH
jgi:hypothetical protein